MNATVTGQIYQENTKEGACQAVVEDVVSCILEDLTVHQLGCGSVAEHFLSMHEALDSTPCTKIKQANKL